MPLFQQLVTVIKSITGASYWQTCTAMLSIASLTGSTAGYYVAVGLQRRTDQCTAHPGDSTNKYLQITGTAVRSISTVSDDMLTRTNDGDIGG